MTLSVDRQQAARMVKCGVMTNGGEEVKHLTFVGRGIANAVRRYDRQLERVSEINGNLIPPFLLALLVSLQFDIHIARTIDRDQLLQRLPACLRTAFDESGGQWPFVAS